MPRKEKKRLIGFEIPFLEKWRITKDGRIYKTEGEDQIEVPTYHRTFQKVDLDGITYRVDELILRTYVGMLPYPIEYKMGDPYFYDLDSIRYKITSEDIVDGLLYLNKVAFPFKKMKRDHPYYMSLNGAVYNLKTHKFNTITHLTAGYCGMLSDMIHRLMWETWKGDILPKYVIDHLDGHKWNNWLYNLEMVTSGENNLRAFQTGLKELKYSKEEIHIMCRMIESNVQINDIYNAFGAKTREEKFRLTGVVSDVVTGRIHKDVSSQYDFSNWDTKKNHINTFTELEEKLIIQLLDLGFSQQKVGDLISRPRTTIQSLKRRNLQKKEKEVA